MQASGPSAEMCRGFLFCDSPDPRQGPESPFPGKEGFGGPKTPISPRSGKGSLLSKIPFFSTREHIEKGDFWTENCHFQPLQGRGEMGVFGPRNPLFQEMGIRAPVWGRGNRNFCCINLGGFCRGFSWRIYLGTLSHKNKEKKSGKQICEKIWRLKNKNREKSALP